MESDIEFLEHIFEQMKDAGLIETKAEFSQMLLGKGASVDFREELTRDFH